MTPRESLTVREHPAHLSFVTGPGKNITRMILPAFLLAWAGCFDYEERIVLAPNYSGFVELTYSVPVYATEDRSLVDFLPIQRARIESKFARLISDGRVSIQDYRMEIARGEEPFERMARVHYRLNFSNPHDLESVLIGKTTVIWRGAYLNIVRTFPVGHSLPASSGRISRRIHELTLKTLQRRSLKFYIIYPWYYDLVTNHGTIVRPGIEYYQMPLDVTMQGGQAQIYWNMEFKANPAPQVSP